METRDPWTLGPFAVYGTLAERIGMILYLIMLAIGGPLGLLAMMGVL